MSSWDFPAEELERVKKEMEETRFLQSRGLMIEQHIRNQVCPEKSQAGTPFFTKKKFKLERLGLGGDSSLDLELPFHLDCTLSGPTAPAHLSTTALLSQCYTRSLLTVQELLTNQSTKLALKNNSRVNQSSATHANSCATYHLIALILLLIVTAYH